MAMPDQLGWRAELAEVVDGQANAVSELFELCVRWYLRSKLSLRDGTSFSSGKVSTEPGQLQLQYSIPFSGTIP
jgi:hypothetical protein